ncbi:MAG: ABC transporter substrate-binding protein [Promethearchaeota archaeon]
MRKYSKTLLISFILMTSICLPILSNVVIAETEEDGSDDFIMGVAGPRAIGNWDALTITANIGNYYEWSALETLFAFPINSTANLKDYKPILATNWTFEERADGMTASGFMAYDGIKSMDIILRKGVTFHDGSNWNATVCKWNIDRILYQAGNIDGCLEGDIPVGTTPLKYDPNVLTARGTWYLKVSDWEKFETADWNVTQFKDKIAYYGEYGPSADYSSRFPRISNVTILEDLESGGSVRIEFNDFRTGPDYLANIRFISKEAYKDYFNVTIWGYGQYEDIYPQDDKDIFPGHLIGTGPYIFEGHNVANDEGTMKRFVNWWNSSNQQADGYHKVERVVVTGFPHTEEGYKTRNTAMLTGDIDWARDRSWEPLDAELMIVSPDINYESLGLEAYGESIVLNCIDETFWRYWDEINVTFDIMDLVTLNLHPNILEDDWTIKAHGVNRAFRKAISYAFDYDTFITVVANNRVVRSGGFLGKVHEYYNPSIPLADTDLTIARQTLIDDDYWGPIVAAKGLTIENDTEDWIAVAEDDPIYKMEYNWDAAHISTRDLLRSALKNIGCGMVLEEDIPDTSTRFIDGTYTFPYFTTDGWAFKVYQQRVGGLAYIDAYFHSPGIIERDPDGAGPFGVIADWWYDVTYGTTGGTYYTSLFPYNQGSNLSFTYNATCDAIIDELWFANETREKELYEDLTEWSQTFQYQHIWLGNDKMGQAMGLNWDVDWYWPTFHMDLIKFVEAEGGAPLVPGFSIGIVISVSLIAFLGIGYSIIRKKRYE